MWDSNALFQLVKSMPQQLSKENIERLQMLIDADKYKNSLLSGFDLCEMFMYAPFCRGCRKSSIYPCAIAYINMLRAEGIDVGIGARPVANANANVYVQQPMVGEQPVPESKMPEEQPVSDVKAEERQEEVVVAAPIQEERAENIVEEPQPVVQEVAVAEEPATQTVEEAQPVNASSPAAVKRKIRIAVARKKI